MADAYAHADEPDDPSDAFLCPLPMCKNAVSGKRLAKGGMDEHREAHIRLGGIERDSVYEPVIVPELRPRYSCSLYLEILLNYGVNIEGKAEAIDSDQGADQSVTDQDAESSSFGFDTSRLFLS